MRFFLALVALPLFFVALPNVVLASTCPALTRTLSQSGEGEDVRALQLFLKEEGHYTYPELTGFFGPVTEDAVKKFQSIHNIVSSGTPETTGFGVVGVKTRAAIALVCDGSSPTTTVSITSLITKLQELLRSSGFSDVSPTGELDEHTLAAIQDIKVGNIPKKATLTVRGNTNGGGSSDSEEEEEETDFPPQFLLAVGGQSLAEYIFTRGTPNVSVKFGQTLRDYMGYSTAGTFSTYGGDFVHDGTSTNATNWTVKLLNVSSAGSPVLDLAGPANVTALNYWWNTIDNTATTGDAADIADSPGPLLRDAITSIDGQIRTDAFSWSQGQSDATYIDGNSSRQNLYKDTLEEIFSRIRTASGNAELPIFIHRIGSHNSITNSAIQAVRDIQTDIANSDPHTYIGTEEYDARLAIAGAYAGATLTNGSPTINMSTPGTSGLDPGDGIIGTNIPVSTRIESVVAGTSITLNKNATGSGTQTIYRQDPVHLYPGSSPTEPFDASGGTQHNVNEGFYDVTARLARKIAQVFEAPDVTCGEGPRISGFDVTPEYYDDELLLEVDHDCGDDFTIGSTQGWRVELEGISRAISDVDRVDSNTIRVTLTNHLDSGELEVWPMWGATAHKDYTLFTKDNASPAAPFQPVSVTATIPDVDDDDALFARLEDAGYTATSTEQAAVTAFIDGLKTDGIWDLLDGLYITAGLGATSSEAEIAGKINWKQASYNLTASGTVTWVADQYVTSDGVGGLLDTNFGAGSLSGIQYGLNNASMWVYIRDNIQNASNLIGHANAFIRPRNASNQAAVRINDNTSGTRSSVSDASGLWAVTRTGANTRTLYRNAVDQVASNGTATSTSLSTNTIKLFSTAGGTPAVNQVTAFGYGAALNATQLTNLRSRIDTLRTALGGS